MDNSYNSPGFVRFIKSYNTQDGVMSAASTMRKRIMYSVVRTAMFSVYGWVFLGLTHREMFLW